VLPTLRGQTQLKLELLLQAAMIPRGAVLVALCVQRHCAIADLPQHVLEVRHRMSVALQQLQDIAHPADTATQRVQTVKRMLAATDRNWVRSSLVPRLLPPQLHSAQRLSR
jgi:hypothetical protein